MSKRAKFDTLAAATADAWRDTLSASVARRTALFNVFALARSPGNDLRDAVRAARVAAGLPVAAAPAPVRRDVVGVYNNALWDEWSSRTT